MKIDTSTGEILANTPEPREPFHVQIPLCTPYNHNKARSDEFSTACLDESLTQQDDAGETDINLIFDRYTKTGQIPGVTLQPLFGDFTEALDFREMQNKIRDANEAFEAIPAKIRERFNNDPQKFIEFAQDKENLAELRKLGLADPEKPPPAEPAPIKVIVTNPEPPKP